MWEQSAYITSVCTNKQKLDTYLSINVTFVAIQGLQILQTDVNIRGVVMVSLLCIASVPDTLLLSRGMVMMWILMWSF